MTRSARDLAVIDRLTKTADTQEKKVSLKQVAQIYLSLCNIR